MIVKKNKYGINGLFTVDYFNKGEIITELRGKAYSRPNRFTYQITKNLHLEPDNNFKFVNHSCNPNIVVDEYKLIALKDIDPGDELCFDYNRTEDVLANPFKCACCGKWIKGKRYVFTKENVKMNK